MPNFTVRIDCITFNHAPYIVDTMNGFCMQKTNFPFVAVILDDTSTDGEPEVIKQYLQEHFDLEDKDIVRNEETNDYILTFAQHKENHNCFFAVYLLKYNHYSIGKAKEPYYKDFNESAKYVAFCEGDDYWTDPNKLQQQVDFLESHPEYGLIYTQANIYVEDEKKTNGVWGKQAEIKDLLFQDSPIPTLTVCFRRELYANYIESIANDPVWVLGDVPLWIFCMSNSKAYFLSEVTGVYRLLKESASHSEDFYKRANFVYGAFKCRQFYAEKYCGRTIARKVAKIRIQNLLSLSFQFDKHHRLPLLNDLVINRIYDFKLWILVILSKYNWGRKFVNKQRNIRNYYNGKFKKTDCKRY